MSRYKGRHRKPTQTGKHVARVATAGVVAFSLPTPAAYAETGPVDQLAELLRCESGGNPANGVINWTAKNPQSSASGAYQIIDGTWRAYGGLEFAPTARQASPWQQTVVASRIAQRGGVSQWACAGRAGFVNPGAISWENVQRLTGGPVEAPAPKRVDPSPPAPKRVDPSPPAPKRVNPPTPSQVDPPTKRVAERHHTVEPGDTLSGIAISHGVGAWKSVFELNRDVIGDDPDLIFPGQELHLPGSPNPTVPHSSVSDRVAVEPAAPVEPAPQVESVPEVAADVAGRLAAQSDSGFSGVIPKVARAGHLISAQFGIDRVLGVGPRPRKSDHTDGYALDFMVKGATGDRVADFVLANMTALDVKYVIWKQRINHGNGWKRMTDRGSATQNHMDHVHVSFNR